MLLQLTELSEEPMHSQISRQLINKIVDGDLAGGDELLPIRTMARKNRINVSSVQRAYQELERDGLIKAKEGKGFYVAALTPEQKQAIAMQRLLGSHSPLHVVEAFSKQLISVFDPEKLRGIVIENLQQFLMVKNVYFAIHDDRIDEYTILPSDECSEKFVIDRDDELLNIISKFRSPISVDLLTCDSFLLKELKAREIKLILPLIETDQLLGFLALTSKINGINYTREELNLLIVLANQFFTALTTARFYVEALEKRRMDEELNMARQIQADLLPKELPDNEHFSLAAYSKPSQTIGGDFYDFIPIDENRFGLIIADGCGKGLPAAMLISQIQAMMKSEINHGNDIQRTLENVNKMVVRYTPKDKFVTLFYGVFDQSNNQFEYATAGHNYPIWLKKTGQSEALCQGGPALGLIEKASYQTKKINLASDDIILFYTDGVTETMDDFKEQYSEKRLSDLLTRSRYLSAQKIVDEILDDLKNFNDDESLQDDRTILVLKVLQGA
ncbi:MAG: SpoIIE family protein phosphatase [bacterium]|jgi:sigma-B regulation protein RsbU (phosphoserine phosphatase)|nr:SpoIIE family protein phosphatase [bacterium]